MDESDATQTPDIAADEHSNDQPRRDNGEEEKQAFTPPQLGLVGLVHLAVGLPADS